jgi:hypothetical protein
MSEEKDDDSDMFGVIGLVAKIFEHVVRMAGRHGIEVDEEKIDAVVKAILEKEDCWIYEGDLSQAVITMLEIPAALGAYNEPLDYILATQVTQEIDWQRTDTQVADRRATLHVLRRPPDKPKR